MFRYYLACHVTVHRSGPRSTELRNSRVRVVCVRSYGREQGGEVGSLARRIDGLLASETAKLFKVEKTLNELPEQSLNTIIQTSDGTPQDAVAQCRYQSQCLGSSLGPSRFDIDVGSRVILVLPRHVNKDELCRSCFPVRFPRTVKEVILSNWEGFVCTTLIE